jgi:uncharacterized protein YPO0396
MKLLNYTIGLLLALLLVACGKPQPYQQQAFVFGTLVEISIAGVPDEQAKAASQAVLAHFDELHRKLHPWQPSALSQLNNAFAHGEHAPVDAELAAADAYRSMLEALSADDLPRFEARFKALLNENTIREVAQFQSQLHRERETIKERSWDRERARLMRDKG